jgi:excisionase family DNA binding protein
MGKDLYTVAEAAERLSLGRTTLYMTILGKPG